MAVVVRLLGRTMKLESNGGTRLRLGHFLSIVGLMLSAAGLAGDSPKRYFDLPPDSAERSLKRLSEQSGREVLFPADAVDGVRTRGVQGEMTPIQALDAMLVGTTLIGVQDDRNGSLTVKKFSRTDRREKNEVGRTLTAPRPGSIEGQVRDARSGVSLEGVRVLIAGTPFETFTNNEGFSCLPSLPTGAMTGRWLFWGKAYRERCLRS